MQPGVISLLSWRVYIREVLEIAFESVNVWKKQDLTIKF